MSYVLRCMNCHYKTEVEDKTNHCLNCNNRNPMFLNYIPLSTSHAQKSSNFLEKKNNYKEVNMDKTFKNESGDKILQFVKDLKSDSTLEEQRNLLAVAYRKISDAIKANPAVSAKSEIQKPVKVAKVEKAEKAVKPAKAEKTAKPAKSVKKKK